MAMRIARANLTLPPDQTPDEDAIWLYANEERQALILARHGAAGKLEVRYLPVCGLRQDFDGSLHFEPAALTSGFPLRIFEDPDLAVPGGGPREWLNSWHSELEWLHAVHITKYSNGILAVHEQFRRQDTTSDSSGDAALLQRFKQRRRRLAEPDFLIFASGHWNFNVRGFNPGGNHGSFLRISTRSVLMFAGGAETGIPRHQRLEEPYDSLSFAPTISEMMGLTKDAGALPGRVIRQVVPSPAAQR